MMKPEEFKKLRLKLGYTQKQVADALGIAKNSAARFERGEMRISEPVARLLRMIAAQRKQPKPR